MFSILTPQVKAESGIIWEDDFEGYTVGTFPSPPWSLWTSGMGTGEQRIVDTVSVSGTQSLRMYGRYFWGAIAARSVTVTADMKIGFEVMIRAENWGTAPEVTGGATIAFASDYPSPALWRQWGNIIFRSDGKIMAAGQELASYTLNTWYKVKEVFDASTKTFSVWINDELKATSLVDTNPDPVTDIEALALVSDHAEQICYFDDVKVFEVALTGKISVALVNYDDDAQTVDIYVDDTFWRQMSDIKHFETKVTEGKDVTGDQEHTIEVFWHEIDSGKDFSKSSTLFVGLGQVITVTFQIDPVFRIRRLTLEGVVEEPREGVFWGLTLDDHFEIYYDKFIHVSQSYISTIAQAAQHSWNELVPFLNQPYDQDTDGRIEIFISDISISIFGKTIINGYVDYNDLNGLGFIYLDDKIKGTSNFVSTVVSHEFTHRIEFAYIDREPDVQRDGWLLEGISQFGGDYAWSFGRIFQKDYVDPFEKEPDTSLVSKLSGYSAGYVFFEFLAEKFGTAIIGEILTKLGTGVSAVEAVEQATGKTFSELFAEFATRNYVNDYEGTAKTFEETDIFAQPFEKYSLGFWKRGVGGSSDVNKWATDYIKFKTSRSSMTISFSGDDGRAFSVMVMKIVGSYASYSVVDMTLVDNSGSLTIENANTFSQIVLVVVRHDDPYTLASYTYQANVS